MARRCGNCIHKNVCELYEIVQDPTHAVACGNFLDTADVVPKSEVIDEFTNRLKERLYTIPTVYNSHFGRMVDEIAKDMKGERDA